MNGEQDASLPQNGAAYRFVYRPTKEDRIQSGIDVLIWASILALLCWKEA
jgi:hypothetical protein